MQFELNIKGGSLAELAAILVANTADVPTQHGSADVLAEKLKDKTDKLNEAIANWQAAENEITRLDKHLLQIARATGYAPAGERDIVEHTLAVLDAYEKDTDNLEAEKESVVEELSQVNSESLTWRSISTAPKSSATKRSPSSWPTRRSPSERASRRPRGLPARSKPRRSASPTPSSALRLGKPRTRTSPAYLRTWPTMRRA